MKDILLQASVSAVNVDPTFEVDVTLIVGGILVSGTITDAKTYYEHHPITAMVNEGLDEQENDSNESSQNDKGVKSEDDLPNYIHLMDAKYFSPGGAPIPGNMGIFIRVDLDDVQGFSFGKLQLES